MVNLKPHEVPEASTLYGYFIHKTAGLTSGLKTLNQVRLLSGFNGKRHDYSVVAVIKRVDEELRVVHCHRFPLGEPYASVIGYVKTLCERWSSVVSVHADQTGVGEYVVEDMEGAGIPVEGIILTAQKKMEILGYMKQQMLKRGFENPL